MAVGYIMAQDKETHCDMIVGSCDRATTVFLLQHLEIVDDAVCDRLATVCTITLDNSIRFSVKKSPKFKAKISSIGSFSKRLMSLVYIEASLLRSFFVSLIN